MEITYAAEEKTMVERLTLSDETYRRLIEFKQVVEAILDEPIELHDYGELVVDRGLNGILEDIIGPQSKETLFESFQQLARRYPEEISDYMIDILQRGEESIREAAKRRLGFELPGEEKKA